MNVFEPMGGDVDPDCDNVFNENYRSEYSSDSEDSSTEEQLIVDDDSAITLGISVEQAMANYEAAGRDVDEEPDRITVAGNANLIKSEVDDLLTQIVSDLKLPYTLADFQRVAINGLALKKNIVLVSPTGSGKMSIPLIASQLLRKLWNMPKGVCIVTQPLSSIMNEKINNKICKVAVLSMRGELTTSSEEKDSVNLSCDLSDILEGKISVIFGHPESFDSGLGRMILRELQKRERILLICIDEFHQAGFGHWDSFRPNMMKFSTGLRLYGIKECPSIAMTATSTEDEIRDVVRALGLREPPVVLTSTPVQSHLKFSVIRRPSNNFGLDGTVSSSGTKKPGLMDLLLRIYLRKVSKLRAYMGPNISH